MLSLVSHSGTDESERRGAARDSVSTRLSELQVHYFDTFGYLKLPGLFVDDIDRISAAFDEVFARENVVVFESHDRIHLDRRRLTIPFFVDQSPTLAALRRDPRVVGTVESLIGPDYEYGESDGNLFFCETSWHNDTYGADLSRRNIKLTFYLEALTAESGAIRVIPGSHRTEEAFSKVLRGRVRHPEKMTELLGVEPRDLPGWPIETVPGDLIVWDYGTTHASFGCVERRRLFTMNFSAPREGA